MSQPSADDAARAFKSAGGVGFALGLVALLLATAPAIANVRLESTANQLSVQASENAYLIGQRPDPSALHADICVLDCGTYLGNTEESGNDPQETVEIFGEDYLLAQ